MILFNQKDMTLNGYRLIRRIAIRHVWFVTLLRNHIHMNILNGKKSIRKIAKRPVKIAILQNNKNTNSKDTLK